MAKNRKKAGNTGRSQIKNLLNKINTDTTQGNSVEEDITSDEQEKFIYGNITRPTDRLRDKDRFQFLKEEGYFDD